MAGWYILEDEYFILFVAL